MVEFLSKLWLLGLIVWLFILVLAAFNFAEIAKTKGHSYGKYFAWCFFTGLIGWIMVIALPNQEDETQTDRAEAEKVKTIKIVRILTIVFVVISLIVWIGVSVYNTPENEMRRLEQVILKEQTRLNNVAPSDRGSQWEKDHEELINMITEYEKQLKELKEEN